MEELILKVEEREALTKGQLNKLRNEGVIPAILYGEKGKNKNLKVVSKDLLRLMHGHHLENSIIKLEIDKKDQKSKSIPVMVKDVQRNPVTDKIIHIDFYQVSLTKEIKVKVPVRATGEAIGVKQDGGTLEHIMWEIEVECLPTNIPESIEVDVSNLKIGDSVSVGDLKVASDIKVLSDLSASVLSVAAPVKEEVAAPAEEVSGAAAPQEPEVIKEKKPKTEEEAQAQAKEKEEKK